MGEKFEVNAVTGTAGLSIPLPASPSRGGQGPQVGLSYSSGAGNGPFGLGFSLSVPSITRKTDQGLPRYLDEPNFETDTYLLSGAEDLVPVLDENGQHIGPPDPTNQYHIYAYRPRIEGSFSRIERWVQDTDGDVHWRVTTPDNVTHIYGTRIDCRVFDPTDDPNADLDIVGRGRDAKIFSWMLAETRDDKGNVTRYEYKREDGVGVDPSHPAERARFDYSTTVPGFFARAQTYLKRVLYGNRVAEAGAAPEEFLFEMVFDYGEHQAATPSFVPSPAEDNAWPVRQDPFSSHRSGFDVRTYRLCRRVLMFHRFDPTPLFVRATEFDYEPGSAFTYLIGVEQRGYLFNGATWDSGKMPRLSLDYQRPILSDELRALPEGSLEGLVGGADGARKQWLDLDGEGIPGVLIDQGGGWFYKANQGGGQLAAPRRLHTQPSPNTLGGAQTLEDIDGDGRLELVARSRSLSGYFERTPEGDFEPLRGFETVPNVNWNDPNLRMIDLDGDGHADILITEDQAFVWYRSRAKQGFEESKRVPIPFDEADGPRVVFNDREQSIQLADMSGDGLVDIVRVRNGEVCYWPNLGFGRFGKKIVLDNCPTFTTPEEFRPTRVRFGDVDGSGTSDLLYLGRSQTTLYLNHAGNALGDGTVITAFPPVDNVAQANITDLLGTGTSCLVWSSPVANPSQNIFYVDLLDSKKPHLLTEVNNNLGAVTRTTYASSTKFYLEDKRAGVEWLTRLPFPVQVVERMERQDAISGGRFVSRYRYRHGFFDGYEREFRGFARVETEDAEDFAEEGQDPLLYQSPVRTISWFHTGAWLEKERLELALQKEYFQEGPPPLLVEDNLRLEELDAAGNVQLVANHSIQDAREAARALKGSPLRTEVYAIDGSEQEALPYVITEANQQVRRLQPSRGEDKFGVFFAYNRETVTISSERNLTDPRVGHQFALDVDRYGAVRRSISLVCGRDPSIAGSQPEQQAHYATLSEADHTHQDSATGTYRLGTQYASRTYEVHNLSLNWAGGQLVTLSDLETALGGASDIRFDDPVPASGVTRRLLDRQQQTFYADDNATEAPLGDPGTRALPYKTYQLALTANQVQFLIDESTALVGVTGAFDPGLLTSEGAYLDRESNGEYWTQSGRALFSGASQFYLPSAALDPFGGMSSVSWDSYHLLPETTTDPVGNIIQSENDYRILAPFRVTDPNLNRSEVRHDALGMVIATAVMGKASEALGDTIDDPTSRLQYDLLAYEERQEPAFVHTIAKETHGPTTSTTRFQESYAYSDGFGRVVQQKVQAERGLAPERLADGTINRDPATNEPIQVPTDPRWVGTGRTIFNNKGNPVKQYEPFFSDTEGYEDEADLVEWGVTPIIRYDSIDRVIRTDLPDGTFTKVEFDAWSQTSFDQNDTCRHPTDPAQHAQWYLDRGAPDPNGSEPSDPDTRAAWLSAQHANTPKIVYLDSLGREFLAVAHRRALDHASGVWQDTYLKTRTVLDVEDNTLAIYDARQHDTASASALGLNVPATASLEQVFDVLGRRLRSISVDAGTRLAVQDVEGRGLRAWNTRGFTQRSEYDPAQRVTHAWVRPPAGAEILVSRIVYGESLDPSGAQNTDPNAASPAQALNLRTRVYLTLDTAGAVKTAQMDFKGNVLWAQRRIAQEYQDTVDWSAIATETDPNAIESAAEALLEADVFETRTSYDALNRITSRTTPDGSVHVPTYNVANYLESETVDVRGTGSSTRVIFGLDYSALGQRLLAEHQDDGSGTSSHRMSYEYDRVTRRLLRQVTRRSDGSRLQDLRYFYDAVGNVTEKLDDADWDPDLASALGDGNSRYVYDSTYQLLTATGREHAGQQVTEVEPPLGSVPHGNDLSGLRDYREELSYDHVGNITLMRHLTGISNSQSWGRNYDYFPDTNRLRATSVPGDVSGIFSARYEYQADSANSAGLHGAMTRMPHLRRLEWDYADRLRHTLKEETTNPADEQHTYFVYDGSGQRVRKVYVHGARIEERIYLGDFELYRRRDGGTLALERETLHVKDNARRIAMVETKTVDVAGLEPSIPLLNARFRYQLDDSLGSTAIEVDGSPAANVISYEEYHPFGSTAFHLFSDSAEVSAKRYRYTGKEKDDETGLYYHGARYYAPWLGRWTSADPNETAGVVNRYRYVSNNPIRLQDPTGEEEEGGFWSGFGGAVKKAAGDFVDGAVESAKGVNNYLEKTGEALGDLAYGAINDDTEATIRGGEALIKSLETISIQNQVRVVKSMAVATVESAKAIYTEGAAAVDAVARGDSRAAGEHTAKALGNTVNVALTVLPAAKGLQALKVAKAAKATKVVAAAEATSTTAKAAKTAVAAEAATAEASAASKAVAVADAPKPSAGPLKNASGPLDEAAAKARTYNPKGEALPPKPKEVLLDTNAVKNFKQSRGALKPGEVPVVSQQVVREVEEQVLKGTKGFDASTAAFVRSFPIVEDVVDIFTQARLRGAIAAHTDASVFRKLGQEFPDLNKIQGLSGDAIIGTTGILTGRPIITLDVAFAKALRSLQFEVRGLGKAGP